MSLEARAIDWQGLIDEALTAPGSIGNTYNRFYEYSFLNQIYLYMCDLSAFLSFGDTIWFKRTGDILW